MVGCASQTPALKGVGMYESDEFDGVAVSMAGGSYLNIASQNTAFAPDAYDNTISFKNPDLGDTDLKWALPPLTGKSNVAAIFVTNSLISTI